MSKKKALPRNLPKTAIPNKGLGRLSLTKIPEDTIHFRFDHFDSSNKFFDGSVADFRWIRLLLDKLKYLHKVTVRTFQTDLRFKKSQYVHKIDWEKTELNSFRIKKGNISPDLFDVEGWQFGISKANGRVHGFFVNNLFYIVWIDPEHRLHKYKKKHT